MFFRWESCRRRRRRGCPARSARLGCEATKRVERWAAHVWRKSKWREEGGTSQRRGPRAVPRLTLTDPSSSRPPPPPLARPHTHTQATPNMAPDLTLQQLSAASLALSGAAAKARRAAAAAQEEAAAAVGRECVAKVWGGGRGKEGGAHACPPCRRLAPPRASRDTPRPGGLGVRGGALSGWVRGRAPEGRAPVFS